MNVGQTVFQLFQKSSQVFRVNSKHYRDAYKLLVAQLVLGFILFYAVAWSSYVVLYFSLGNVLSGLSVALLGLPSSLWGLWVLRYQLRPRKAALIANFGGCAVLIGITASTGAAASPIFAWFFFVTITTFLLNGRKAGYTMAFTTMTASCFIIGMDMLGRRLPTGFSFQVGSTLYNLFIAYTYVSAILSLAVVTHIYDRLVNKGLYDATQARDVARHQFKNVANLLNNMSQAVFVINETGRIVPPVSLFSETMFGSKIENTSIHQNLFKDIPRNSEEASRIDTTLALAFGADELQWSEVEGLMPQQVEYQLNGTKKTLRCIYRPIYDEADLVKGIMCVIEDVTALLRVQKDLQSAREENMRNARTLEHIVRVGLDAFDGFMRHTANHIEIFYDAMVLVEKDRRIIVDTCLRSIHTIKGNARQLGLMELAADIHQIEQDMIDYLRAQHHDESDSIKVISGLMRYTKNLVISLQSYDRVMVNFFKMPSALKSTFYKITLEALDCCHEMGIQLENRQVKNMDFWIFHCFFVGECLRFFEVPDLLKAWENFVQNGILAFKSSNPSDWRVSWEEISRQIRLHEGVLQENHSRDNASGLLQIATGNVDRIRDFIHSIESEENEDQLRLGLTELRRLLSRLDEVQLESSFKKFVPMVEELSLRFGKQVRIDVDAGKTSLARDLVDILNDVLMHIIRNIMDHGLETPELRKKQGKDQTGTIRVEAVETSFQLEIRISDDGAGIDTEKLVSKARARGLIAAEAKLTEAEAIQLIFVPSLSTKDLETEISGRGFGMEAVRAAIEELGGEIRVDTQRQKGTCFTISIPLQVKIPTGMDGIKKVS